MAGASDKARFYLEKSVPELQELQRKKIFTKQEVSSIVKKRSDFEHKLNARSSTSADYAKYAAYEMNIDSLQRKRTKRLGVKAANHTGQRRIFFLLERATRKFHGDLGLWMQYIGFARKQKSNKKVSEIITQMVRLFPTNPQIWMYAANYAVKERGDISEARSLMQKGLRFCKRSEDLWIEYARLEMIYIAKLAARSKILGLDQHKDQHRDGNEAVQVDAVELSEPTAVAIPPVKVQEERPNEAALAKFDSSSVRSGAIPRAIFDAAMKEFRTEGQFAWLFFDMVAEFDVSPRQTILAHVVNVMQSVKPIDFRTVSSFVQQPLLGLGQTSSEFPSAVAISLDRLKDASQILQTAQSRRMFYDHVMGWMSKLLESESMDQDVRRVLQATLKKTKNQFLAIEA